MNKKYVAIIIFVVTAIGIIVLSYDNYLSTQNNKSNNQTSSLEQQSNKSSSNTGKHFNIELHESIGIKANP